MLPCQSTVHCLEPPQSTPVFKVRENNSLLAYNEFQSSLVLNNETVRLLGLLREKKFVEKKIKPDFFFFIVTVKKQIKPDLARLSNEVVI